ncbi:alpha-tubulin binding protein [Aureococcus anophagefferens]|nr:alpha-tubulin binding protein [Aureococcus anophagefferens]
MLRAKMQRETGADLTVKRNRRMHPMKQFMEAQLGKPQSQADLGSFLAHDRKVLRFDCVWDDRAALRRRLKFKLHYFLSDDTIEILQEQDKVAGGPLASSPSGPSKTEYYHWRDLVLGKPVVVFNRNLLLIDADPYTVDHYNAVKPLGRPIAVDASRFRDDLVQTPVPPFNGFGSERTRCGPRARPRPRRGRGLGPAPVTAYYGAEDLHVGNEIEFLGHKFTIYEADEYSLRYMEAQGAPRFPKSDLFVVVNKFAAMTKLSDAFEL